MKKTYKENELPTTSSVVFPDNTSFSGQGVGVAVDKHGCIYYLHRGSNIYGSKKYISENVIITLNPDTYEIVGSYGANIFKSPHGIDVDAYGNMWVTDISLNKVIKLNPQGQIISEYGAEYPFYLNLLYKIKNVFHSFPLSVTAKTFARPTGVIAQENGSFVVTDGYRNNRLAMFDSSGNLIWQVNSYGSRNGEFNLPHGLTQDEEGNIYVADRKNCRVQVFTSEGKWKSTWKSPKLGRPYAIAYNGNGVFYIADGGDMLDGKSENPRSKVAVLNKEGKILGYFGKYGKGVGKLDIPHDIAVGKDGSIYVAELNGRRLQRFFLNK